MSPLKRALRWLLVAFAAGIFVAACSGCGPALTSQVQLNEMGTRARKDCEAQQRRKKCEIDSGSMECGRATVRCYDALKCAEAVQASNEETQRAQLRRATVGTTSAEEAVVQLKHDSAALLCRPYRPGAVLPPVDPLPKPPSSVRAAAPPPLPKPVSPAPAPATPATNPPINAPPINAPPINATNAAQP